MLKNDIYRKSIDHFSQSIDGGEYQQPIRNRSNRNPQLRLRGTIAGRAKALKETTIMVGKTFDGGKIW